MRSAAVATGERMAPTAGFRNAAWTSDALPDDVRPLVRPLRTLDGAVTNGFLYARGGERTVVCIMHPREFLATHYLIPHILRAGCAAWTQASRSVGNDLRLEHEVILHDVAAATVWLREAGFERIVLLGNSGGAGLYTFYAQQALTAPERRLERTPGGRPTRLLEASMPEPDGLVLVSPHPGQGKLLLACIDPAVTDEDDPLASDPALDFLEPANGFREPPESSAYPAEFVERHRAAQRARVERLDTRARELIAERLAARKRAKGSGSRADRVGGGLSPIMVVWRTNADLRCWDLSLDPSERRYGSVWGADPIASNYGSVGFGRLCTPESWLSTWSGLSSRAALELTAPAIEQPTLLLSYTGDNTVFPSDFDAIVGMVAASDREVHRFRGDHHGQALAEGEAPGRDAAGRCIETWLRERFPTLKPS
jgi:hypothetical protein